MTGKSTLELIGSLLLPLDILFTQNWLQYNLGKLQNERAQCVLNAYCLCCGHVPCMLRVFPSRLLLDAYWRRRLTGQVMPKQEQTKAKEGCEIQQGEKKLKPCCACPETKKVVSALFFSFIRITAGARPVHYRTRRRELQGGD